jgi:alpha-glucosidase
LSCYCCKPAFAQKTIQITSPDGLLQYAFKLKGKTASYNVSFKKQPIIVDAALSLTFSGNSEFKDDLTIIGAVFREAAEQYELIVGKTKKVNHPFREVTIKLKEATKPFRIIHLVVRTFNDGLAFR